MTARSVVNGSAWTTSIGSLLLVASMFAAAPLDTRLVVASVVVLAATLGALLTHFPGTQGSGE